MGSGIRSVKETTQYTYHWVIDKYLRWVACWRLWFSPFYCLLPLQNPCEEYSAGILSWQGNINPVLVLWIILFLLIIMHANAFYQLYRFLSPTMVRSILVLNLSSKHNQRDKLPFCLFYRWKYCSFKQFDVSPF